MPNIFELAAYIVYSIIVVALVIDNVIIRLKRRKLVASSLQLILDKSTLIQKLADVEDKNSLENSEGFVRFISESRDWAFTYIEDIQEALTEYDNALSLADARLINEAYKKLIDYLPNEDVVS